MKRVINILSLIATGVAAVVIICTFLTSYQFIYVNYMFSSYLPMQIALGIMMAIWTIRFWIHEVGSKRITYSAISFALSLVLFFSINYVK